ncbi:MAG: alpha-hydroxy-acid oxidizing protein [Steroidobacteraceae bacterium]
MLGRAPLYGLGAAGEAGVDRALDILTTETDRALGMLGCNSVTELGAQHLRRA